VADGGDGGLLVVARELGGLDSELLEDVVDEGVHGGHGIGGDADVGVHLLQHLEDVDFLRLHALLWPLLPLLVAAVLLASRQPLLGLRLLPSRGGAFSVAGSSSAGFFATGFFSALGAMDAARVRGGGA
jgi:hypothetical protein